MVVCLNPNAEEFDESVVSKLIQFVKVAYKKSCICSQTLICLPPSSSFVCLPPHHLFTFPPRHLFPPSSSLVCLPPRHLFASLLVICLPPSSACHEVCRTHSGCCYCQTRICQVSFRFPVKRNLCHSGVPLVDFVVDKC